MNIGVCIKQVPVDAGLRLQEGRCTLLREGVESRINPHDLQALEVALGLRDGHGGEVTVLSMGPPQAQEALREALAMGVDRGVLLTDPAFAGADTLATATVLAQAIRRLGHGLDLVLCGVRSSDSDTGQVGPQVAEDLGMPHVAYVTDVSPDGDSCVVRRRVDGQIETIRVRLPALLTTLQASTRPRDIPFLEIERAFDKKRVVCWGLKDLGLDSRQVGFLGSATWVRGIREPQAARRTKRIEGTPEEAVQAILQALEERYIVE